MATGTILLPILGAIGDPTNPPAMGFSTANRPYLAFDSATDELCHWSFRMPENYASAPVAKILYSADTATTGDAMFAVDVMATSDGENVETDSFDTANASAATTVPGTATFLDSISITLTNADSVAANDYCAIRLFRDISGDSVAGDLFVWGFSLEYTTT